MNKSEKYIKSVAQGRGNSVKTNVPWQYKGLQTQYLVDRTRKFANERAHLASDYIQAEVQGLAGDFYAYTTVNIRMADIINSGITPQRRVDDYKEVFIPDLPVDYIPIGAKIKAMGSVWICTNPHNISDATPTSIVARCRTTYNSYDFYGNIVTEPLVIEEIKMIDDNNDDPANVVLMDGRFKVTCQKNENTMKLGQNQRIILGTKPYSITGFTDFIQEFTGDRESAHLLSFTVHIEEPTEADDISVNFIANGKSNTFKATLSGATEIPVGAQTQITAHFVKNGIEVEPTLEKPQTWLFSTSNMEVATIDENGILTAHTSGEVSVTAILLENPAVMANMAITIPQTVDTPYTAFLGHCAKSVTQYNKADYTAAYFENGAQTEDAIQFELNGAKKTAYESELSADGHSITITCLKPSNEPLVLTARHGEYSTDIEITLLGY